jgi:4-amino-4-deoxy-L-arabinose transferase-like glycosyltransferase
MAGPASPLADDTRARARSTRVALLIALAICMLGWFIASGSTLFDRDEPRFAQATVEMLHSGNWLYPTFNEAVRADKPILVYWFMALPMHVFGASAWSARAWSPVFLAASALLAFFVARRLFDARTGWLAMLFLAVAPLALLEGTVATTDALLLLCITGALTSLAFSITDGFRTQHAVWMSIALTGALLAKGPVGLAVPLLSAALAMWLLRRERVLDTRFVVGTAIASLVAIGAFLAWGIPADRATGGEFLRRGIGHHVIERIATPLENHGGGWLASLPYYLPVVVVGFLPGFLFLPPALSAFLRGKLGDRKANTIVVAWIVPCFVLMTVVSTKLPHYVLPIWPGLAIACAATVTIAERGELDASGRLMLRHGAWYFGFVAVVLVAGLAIAPFFVKLDGVRTGGIALAVLLAVTCTLAIVEHVRGRYRRSAYVIVGGLAVSWLTGATLLLPVVERTKVAPEIAAAIRERTSDSVPVARFKFVEPSLDFYLDRPPIKDLTDEDALRAYASADTPGLLVIPRERLDALRDVLPTTRWTEIASAHGFNLSKGKPLELVALGRNLPTASR